MRPHSRTYQQLKPLQRLIISVSVKLLNVWFSTCRIRIIGRDIHDKYITGPARVVGATWHRGAIFLVWFYRNQHPMIMFSRSRDGDLLAGFAEKLGIVPARGSSGKGGREAVDEMNYFLHQPGSRKAATVLDGPRGPRYAAKTGMIVLAKEAATPLLPIAVSAWPAVTLKKTWDHTIIPMPFSTVTVVYRRPWIIPPEASGEDIEQVRREVEETLNAMMAEADNDAGYRRSKQQLGR
jgi:lysophospholipid acyltransferase (LPLAT)-like uncharacterized protein